MERFRLLTEYHSFLFKLYGINTYYDRVNKFPSPYGVSFILICTIFSVNLPP